MNKKYVKYLLGGAGAAVLAAGLPLSIDVDRYPVYTDKTEDTIVIAVLSDLHCRRFGRKQKRITDRINQIKPDLIVIPGDLFDVDRNYDYAFELAEQLQAYRMYYTSGNHDLYLEELDELKKQLEKTGVCVLDEKTVSLKIRGTQLELAGLSDMGRKAAVSAEQLNAMYRESGFRILVSHRPDYTKLYAKSDVDLVICGHDHGGQWRLPFTHQGLVAPQKGFFPKQTEGLHELNHTTMAVSRGLASGAPWLPRLYNNPEIMVIEIKPEK